MLTDQELSALVAELVYRYHVLREDRTRMALAVNSKGTAAGMGTRPVPPFATDQGLALDAALQVAWDVDIQAPDSDSSCRVKLLLRRPSQPEIAFGTTVARALCFAALRAVGVTFEDDGEGE